MLSTLRIVWRTLDGQRLRYGAAIAAMAAASGFLYLAPLVPQAVLDGAMAADPSAASATTHRVVALLGGAEFLADNLWLPCLVVVTVTACAAGFTYLRMRWSAEASEAIVLGVRDRLYDHLQRLPCRTLDGAETGDLVQRCTSDVETLRKFLSSQVVEIGRALIMLAVPLPLMLGIDARMTAVSVVLLPLIAAFSFVFFRRVQAVFMAADEAEGKMTARIQENLTGIRVVRAFARQAHEQERFEALAGDYRDLDHRLYVLLSGFWSTSDLLCFLQRGLVMGAGVYWLLQGSLQVGALFFFLTAVNMFMWPVRHMGRILTELGKALVALGRLDEILGEALEAAPAAASGLDELGGEVVFDDVSFAHGEQRVLDGVSFRVPAGGTLGILGASGAGKSTIVQLLLRFYDDHTGSIRVGGHELRTLERGLVRGRVAVALQEPFLFSKSIGDNVRLGAQDGAETHAEVVVEATRRACIHETVAALEQGYETQVGERGVTLSGGQRQRLSLARALLREPSVLILDDALSAVDTGTERSILQALDEVRGRQTTIIIAHRLSTLRGVDQVLVLDHGRVVQLGTHDSLLAEDGPYRRLWRVQTALDDGAVAAPSTAAETPSALARTA
jgi:ATP-binding cassette subfamily B protein